MKRKRSGVSTEKNYSGVKLPTDLWLHLAEFLNFRDLASFSYLRKKFFFRTVTGNHRGQKSHFEMAEN